MAQSIYSFVRTELRTLQNMCNGDNELFLNQLADMVGKQDEKIDALQRQIAYLKAMGDEE